MSKRHEREIRELLNHLDGFLPEDPPSSAPRPKQPVSSFSISRWGREPGRFLLAGVVLAVLASVLKGLLAALGLHLASPLVSLPGLAALFLLLVGYGLSLAQARRRPKPRWRGRIVQFTPHHDSSADAWRFRLWQLRATLHRWLSKR